MLLHAARSDVVKQCHFVTSTGFECIIVPFGLGSWNLMFLKDEHLFNVNCPLATFSVCVIPSRSSLQGDPAMKDPCVNQFSH